MNDAPQTLFHISIPDFRTTYAISKPDHLTPVPLRRYGFHGLSCKHLLNMIRTIRKPTMTSDWCESTIDGSILQQMSEKLQKDPQDINLVVAHLGSGGSVCLIQGGNSANTSMGLTPLEGNSE